MNKIRNKPYSNPMLTFRPAPPANEHYQLEDSDGNDTAMTTFEGSEVTNSKQPAWDVGTDK